MNLKFWEPTHSSLANRGAKALKTFTEAVNELEVVNEEIEKLEGKKVEQISKLNYEISDLQANKAANLKFIQNVKNLFS